MGVDRRCGRREAEPAARRSRHPRTRERLEQRVTHIGRDTGATVQDVDPQKPRLLGPLRRPLGYRRTCRWGTIGARWSRD